MKPYGPIDSNSPPRDSLAMAQVKRVAGRSQKEEGRKQEVLFVLTSDCYPPMQLRRI
jgi:hypothetical protein